VSVLELNMLNPLSYANCRFPRNCGYVWLVHCEAVTRCRAEGRGSSAFVQVGPGVRPLAGGFEPRLLRVVPASIFACLLANQRLGDIEIPMNCDVAEVKS
jgi:hypothetical protein